MWNKHCKDTDKESGDKEKIRERSSWEAGNWVEDEGNEYEIIVDWGYEADKELDSSRG